MDYYQVLRMTKYVNISGSVSISIICEYKMQYNKYSNNDDKETHQ